MEKQVLKPSHDTLEINGRLSYTEGSHSWSIIRFKKELLQEFSQLRERRGSFSYKIILFRNYKIMAKALKEMQQKDEALPLLLLFYKEPQEETG